MFVFVLSCITLCPFLFYNHHEEEERACCFSFIFLRMSCYCKFSVTLPHGAVLTMPWVGLRCVIVVFPDHTHLHFVNIFQLFFISFYIVIIYHVIF